MIFAPKMEIRKLSEFLDPRIIFLGITILSFLCWVFWKPEAIGLEKHISIHSFLVVVFSIIFLLIGITTVKPSKSYLLTINYSALKLVFIIFTVLSLVSTWYFVLKPFFIYGFATFFQQIISYFKTHQIALIQGYYLTPGLGLGFITLRWMLAPTFALLQELRRKNRINKLNHFILSLIFLFTALSYHVSISSIIRFEEMLVILGIFCFWKKRVKLSSVLLFVVLLYFLLSIGGIFKFAGVYGYSKIDLPAICALGIRHLINYYGTSLNYGFYLIDNYSQYLSFPRTTFAFLYSALNIGSPKGIYDVLYPTPVFMEGYITLSAYGDLATEYGEALIPVMFLLGMFIGYIYFNFGHNVMCRLLYPFIVVGILEFPRYFYFTGTPLISALFLFLLAIVISNPSKTTSTGFSERKSYSCEASRSCSTG